MTAVATAPVRWARRKWVGMVTAVFVVQVAFILWLDQRQPLPTRPAAHAPTLRFAGTNSSALLAAADATLFALPHADSFAGPAWLMHLRREYPPFHFNEEPLWLKLEPGNLGLFALRLSPEKVDPAAVNIAIPEPSLFTPSITAFPLPASSTLRIEGRLKQRPLLTPVELPSWPPRQISPTELDVLTNTVVQALINPAGEPVSVALVGLGSGSKEADDFALRATAQMRFAPAAEPEAVAGTNSPNPLARLVAGQVIFQWHTAATNQAAVTR